MNGTNDEMASMPVEAPGTQTKYMSPEERAEWIRSQQNAQGLLEQDGVVIEFPKKGAYAQDPAEHARDTVKITEGFLQLHSGLQAIETLGIPVECPIPAYAGLRAYYRTNIPSRYYKKDRPLFEMSAELEAWRDRLAATTQEEKDQSWIEQVNEFAVAQEKEVHDFRIREIEWLSRFLVRIEPWNFGTVSLNEDGDPVITPYPAPAPYNKEAYHVLVDEFEDLYAWLVDPATFAQALAIGQGKNG